MQSQPLLTIVTASTWSQQPSSLPWISANVPLLLPLFFQLGTYSNLFKKSGHFFFQNSLISPRFAEKISQNPWLSLQDLGSLLAHHSHLCPFPALLCPTQPSTHIILTSLFLKQAGKI